MPVVSAAPMASDSSSNVRAVVNRIARRATR